MSDTTTVMSIPTVCDRLTISEATLRRYAAIEGFPRKINLGRRRIVYLKSDIEAWLAKRQEAAEAVTNG